MTQIPDYSQGPAWNAQQPMYGAQAPKNSGLAIASLVCGILGLGACCAFIPSILGITLGAAALPPIGRGEARGKGMAISGVVLGVIGLAIGAAFWIVTANSPVAEPVPGRDVSEADRTTLVSMGVLEDGEQIELFYASGMFSIREGGAMVTDRRLVIYHAESDIESCRLADILAIDFTPGEGWVGEGGFLIECEDDSLMLLNVTSMNEGDKLFERVLRKKVNEARETLGRSPALKELPSESD